MKCVFPGSFDPFHNGHKDVIERALPIFDEIVIAVGENSDKNCMFSLEKRKSIIESIFKDHPKVSVKSYTGLTVSFCKKNGAKYILRGLRNPSDFEFEKGIVQANRNLDDSIETILILTRSEVSYLSSSIVRDIIKNKGDHSKFVPWDVNLYKK